MHFCQLSVLNVAQPAEGRTMETISTALDRTTLEYDLLRRHTPLEVLL
jgi:hypothetical protein